MRGRRARFVVLEVERDKLALLVFNAKGDKIIYAHEGYEKDGTDNSLRLDIDELRRVRNYEQEVLQWELNTAENWSIDILNGGLDDGKLNVIADEREIYFERLRGAGKMVFIR